MRPRICFSHSGGSDLADRAVRATEPPTELVRDYQPEFTEESYREIERLALWSRARGPRLYLIGGWAAWRYHQGLGSRDIDVIFPSRSILEGFLPAYYRENGYERQPGLIEISYHKPVTTAAGTFYIELDAAPIDGSFPFHEDHALNIPYTLLQGNHQRWRVGSEDVLVPTPELLLLQKVKAFRDRSWDIRSLVLDPARSQYLRNKIAKDVYDIQNLVPYIKRWKVVEALANEHSCKELVREALERVGVTVPFSP